MKTPILNCKIGDIIEWCPCYSIVGNPFLAIIIGEDYSRGHERWLVQPLGDQHPARRKPYLTKKIATVWKKVC